MKKNWWKVIAALLVIYATAFSFFRPLEPGLIQTDITELSLGENTFSVTGYNTHFLDYESSLTGFLKIDSVRALPIAVQKVTDQSHATFSVNIPAGLERNVVDLFNFQ